MNSNINCGIKGAYRVQIKDKFGKIVEDTDYFDNDITNVGLNYPFFYSFARCFMFLSLGSNTVSASGPRQNFSGFPINTLTGILVYDPAYTGAPPVGYAGQTGLYYQPTQYIGWPGYELGNAKNNFNNSSSSTCGTNFTNQGVNLYRGWTVPTGLAESPGSYLNQNVTINSFMVSPSSGNDPLGKYAFSLVDRSVVIPSGFSATITYQLSLSFPTYTNLYNLFQSYTGATPFNYTGFTGNYAGNPSGWFSLANAFTGINGSETGLLSLWGNLSGIYRQIYPGIELVNPLGACCIPNRGNQLEPYIINCPNMNFYLSSDMTQFGVNKYGQGGPSTGEYGAYNSNGLACNYIEFLNYSGLTPNFYTSDQNVFPSAPNDYYYSGAAASSIPTDPLSSLETSQEVGVSTINNIHLNTLLPISNYNSGAITPPDYRTPFFVSAAGYPIAYATPGTGINPSFTNYGNKALFSSYLRELPNPNTPNPLANTGAISVSRINSVTKKAFFPPIQSLGTNSRFGSLTLGYNTSPGTISIAAYSPYMDFLFFDTSGRIANMPHYRYIPDIYLTNRGSGVAQVIFSITGANFSHPSSVNRFWQVSGFMGPGYNNVSGLNPYHPLLAGLIPDPNNIFIPPYTANIGAPSGIVCPGQILGIGVSGGFDNTLGWGAVYGVVGNSGFYMSLPDCGIIDSPTWSGFTGTSSGIPDTTGSPIYWPVIGSGIGVNISGLQYFLKGYSNLGLGYVNDTGNFYSSGVYQMINDVSFSTSDLILPTGNVLDLASNPYTQPPSNGYSHQVIYISTLSGISLTPAINPFSNYGTLINVLPFVFTGALGHISLTPLFGIDSSSLVYLSGFSNNSLSNLSSGLSGVINGSLSSFSTPLIRGSGLPWNTTGITSFVLSGGVMPTLFETSINQTGYYVFNDGGTWYNSHPITYPITGMSMSPTQFYAPSGAYIRHFESLSLMGSYSTTVPYVIGNRILPNYGLANNSNVNTYTPVQGGQFPGLSTENGMEVFVNFAWSG